MDQQTDGMVGVALAFGVGPWLMWRAWGRRPPRAVAAASVAIAAWTLWRAFS